MADYDLVAIGGGAAGLSAVRSARWAGRTAALVTDGPPGGDCTFTGCVPSKALISVAAAGGTFADAMARIRASIDEIAATESAAVLRSQGVDVYEGRAELTAPGSVSVGGQRLGARHVVIATGANAVVPPIPGLDRVDPLTNETVFDLTTAPTSLAVLGGGPIGCELAQAMSRLGVRVVLYEALDRLLTREEPRASAVVAAALAADGIDVRLGRRVAAVERTAAGIEVTADDGSVTTVERILVAVGRRPHTDGLGLDRLGVDLDDGGHVIVDDRMRTTADGVYAAGDVTGRLPFTHAADEMGRIAAGQALRLRPRGRWDAGSVPWVTFTDPEVARVGATEADAARRGGRVAELAMTHVDRAVVEDRTEGFVKIVTGPRRLTRHLFGGRVVGATVVGPRAGELINELALAVRTGMFTGRLGQTVHAYPTWGVAIPQVVAQFFHEMNGHEARRARD